MPLALFVVILVVVAGLVAAAGDRMGHRAARRKVRIGKLRPRDVSTVIAVATGVIISLVTYAVVFAIAKDFREALLNYDQVKARLESATGELSAKEQLVAQAEGRAREADAQRTAAETLAGQKSAEVEQLEGQRAGLELSVGALNAEVAAKQREVKNLNREIQNYEGRMGDLREVFSQTRTDLLETLEGEIVLLKGTALAYQRITPDTRGNLESLLQGAVTRVTASLSKDGLAVGDASAEAGRTLIAEYPDYADSVVIISAAQNVIKGSPVLLGFEAQELTPLVSKGGVVLEALIDAEVMKITAIGGVRREHGVPPAFDADSLVDLTVRLQEAMLDGARALGFLPNLRTDSVDTAAAAIATIASDLAERQRPFVIQFVAKQDLNALDGLDEVEIYVSNPRQP